ncbi:hypothetical protein ACVIHF_000631 [Bradyrhizobium sp. USDA 4506]
MVKVVILAGCLEIRISEQRRISEERHVRSKPMIQSGAKPILWPILKICGAPWRLDQWQRHSVLAKDTKRDLGRRLPRDILRDREETMVIAPMFWYGCRIFLTGHTGSQGSWTSLLLSRLDAQVLCYSLPQKDCVGLFEATGLARGYCGTISGLKNVVIGCRSASEIASADCPRRGAFRANWRGRAHHQRREASPPDRQSRLRQRHWAGQAGLDDVRTMTDLDDIANSFRARITGGCGGRPSVSTPPATISRATTSSITASSNALCDRKAARRADRRYHHEWCDDFGRKWVEGRRRDSEQPRQLDSLG